MDGLLVNRIMRNIVTILSMLVIPAGSLWFFGMDKGPVYAFAGMYYLSLVAIVLGVIAFSKQFLLAKIGCAISILGGMVASVAIGIFGGWCAIEWGKSADVPITLLYYNDIVDLLGQFFAWIGSTSAN